MKFGILALMMPLLLGAAPEAPPFAGAFTFVKVIAPEGSKTTWHPRTAHAAVTENGTAIGLRPGYSYRFELANVGENRNVMIWPSIEVLGTLVARPNMKVSEHPIPIVLSEEDIGRIIEGRFLAKIYYLEDPDKAVNGPQPLGVPMEASTTSEVEAIKEATERGRLMIIVRAGERMWTDDELVRENVPGSIWIPSMMKSIPMPATSHCLPYCRIPLYDPLLGPKQLTGECLYDGGDRNLNLGIGRENKLYGLDPSDTALEYTTPSGKKVTSSNRVCICVPRFAVRRVELSAIVQHGYRGPQIELQSDRQREIARRLPPLAVARIEQPINQTGAVRASGLLLETGPLLKEALVGKPAAVAGLKGAQVTAQVREPEDLTVYPDCGLILTKRVDPPNPKQIGEVVTFFLSYRNPGTQPMTDLAVSDSLTARLEYIEGSAKSDRAATFTASPNEAGSVVLRGPLMARFFPANADWSLSERGYVRAICRVGEGFAKPTSLIFGWVAQSLHPPYGQTISLCVDLLGNAHLLRYDQMTPLTCSIEIHPSLTGTLNAASLWLIVYARPAPGLHSD